MRLDGEVAIFTGSASGSGAEIAVINAREREPMTDFNRRGADPAAAPLDGAGRRAIGAAAEVASKEQLDNCTARACDAKNTAPQAPRLRDCTGSVLPCGPCKARACGVCGAVARSNLTRLAAVAAIVEVSRGQTFIHEGAPAEHFCILIQGSAKLYKLLADGRRQIIGFGYAGSFLGLAASEGYAFSAEALESIRMCRLSRQRLLPVLADSHAMEQRLLEVAVQDLVRAQEQMLLLGRKTATERMASFLLFEAAQAQSLGVVRRPRIRLPMSRSDIADYLGLTVETISRTLAKLKKRGVIAIPNVHELVILDLSCLDALARGSEAGNFALRELNRIFMATSSVASRRSPGAVSVLRGSAT